MRVEIKWLLYGDGKLSAYSMRWKLSGYSMRWKLSGYSMRWKLSGYSMRVEIKWLLYACGN